MYFIFIIYYYSKAAGASFKMATVPKREQLALALAEKAGQRHRAMKQKAMEAAKRSMLRY